MGFEAVKEKPSAVEGVWKDRLEPAVKEPGEWFLVWIFPNRDSAYSAVSKLKAGEFEVPEGTWQFRGGSDARGGLVYARFQP